MTQNDETLERLDAAIQALLDDKKTRVVVALTEFILAIEVVTAKTADADGNIEMVPGFKINKKKTLANLKTEMNKFLSGGEKRINDTK